MLVNVESTVDELSSFSVMRVDGRVVDIEDEDTLVFGKVPCVSVTLKRPRSVVCFQIPPLTWCASTSTTIAFFIAFLSNRSRIAMVMSA